MKATLALALLSVASCAAPRPTETAMHEGGRSSDSSVAARAVMPDAPFRTSPPPPMPVPPFVPEAPIVDRLPNGIRVVSLPNQTVATAMIGVVLPTKLAGTLQDFATAWLLQRSLEIARATIRESPEDLRVFQSDHLLRPSMSSGPTEFSVNVLGPSSETPAMAQFLVGRVLHPEFTARQMESCRTWIQNQLFITREPPATTAGRLIATLLGNVSAPVPSLELLKRVTVADVTAAHEAMLDPSHVTIIATGDIDGTVLLRTVDEAFGRLQARKSAASPSSPKSRAALGASTRAFVLDSPRPLEVTVSFGTKVKGGAKNVTAAEVLLTSAYLHARGPKGFMTAAYGNDGMHAGAVYIESLDGDLFFRGTFTTPLATLGERLEALRDAVGKLGTVDIDDRELAMSRTVASAWIEDFYSTIEATHRRLASLVMAGQSPTSDVEIATALPTMGAPDIARVLRIAAAPADMKFAFVGDANRMLPILQDHGFRNSVRQVQLESPETMTDGSSSPEK